MRAVCGRRLSVRQAPRHPVRAGPSEQMYERRTAIVATYFFIRQDDTADTFRIAEILVDDEHDLIHKAVGGWVREAGKQTPTAC